MMKEQTLLVPHEEDPLLAFAPEEPGLQWQRIMGMAVHGDANWELEICRKTCMTLAEAKSFAAADDRITFFFYVKHYAIMCRHQVLHAGDVVFFSGTPVLVAEAGADSFEKPAAPGSRLSITAAPGNHWVSIQAHMQVPFLSSTQAHAYLWPCLLPGQAHGAELQGGGLQAVLCYCPPHEVTDEVSEHPFAQGGWWVCGQYVHAGGKLQAEQTCFGGPYMAVAPGDVLSCRIVYDAANHSWLQTITNCSNKDSVIFPMNAKQKTGQALEKNMLGFCLEKLLPARHEHSRHLHQCLSLFNVIARLTYPQSQLGQDLNQLPYIDNARLSDDQTCLHIGRIVLYNPMMHAGE
ncbi:MAG: hypothetical protein WA071_13390 [Undibacterium umbellatum]|uniref:hypothetical protein n=1 Tax=Undibacterium umbellatum TaxID=2762300 RepID=UPI003BB6824A